MVRRTKALFLLITLLLTVFCSALTVSAAEPIVYVSGDPDCYPIEYYDSDSKEYKGYIPTLLFRFGKEYGYDIRYLNKGASDNRKSDYQNAQAEIVSAALAGDFTEEQISNGISVFCADKEYYVIFTEIASDSFKTQLKEFFSKITTAQANKILLDITGGKPTTVPMLAIIIAAAVVILLIATLIILALRLKKYRKDTDNKETDVITGIGNYAYLERYFKQFIDDKNRSLYSAVYFGAFLKDGREDQNAFLKNIAVVLNSEIGDTDILSRIDDGFFVLRSLSERSHIEAWTEEVLDRLDGEFNEKKEFSSAIITGGIYILGEHDRDLDKMISNSAYCCRYARKHKQKYTVYSRSVERAEKEEDQLREDIKVAFQKDEFTAYLQFFVNAQNRQILGAEALSRWNHPTMGVLNPVRYIELLENEHMIQELDFTILRKACETLEEVCKKTKKAFFIAFNFSRNTLVLPDFVERVEKTVSAFHFPKECLLLEVTEYVRVADNQVLFENIKKIKDIGIKVVIDDFGSGFSDMIDIGKANFDGVKLDKTLIDGEHTKEDDIILRSLVNMMNELGMTVIAEGIEKEEQVERLVKAGCHIIQGYYFYLPLPKTEALRVLLQ